MTGIRPLEWLGLVCTSVIAVSRFWREHAAAANGNTPTRRSKSRRFTVFFSSGQIRAIQLGRLLDPRFGWRSWSFESKAGSSGQLSGPLFNTAARRLPEFALNRGFLGIYARTFQFISVAVGRDARKTQSVPLELGFGARKFRTRALIVAFRRTRFEIHASVDGGTRPCGGFATALEPKSRTQTRISTFG
jgi:hypothetical protein